MLGRFVAQPLVLVQFIDCLDIFRGKSRQVEILLLMLLVGTFRNCDNAAAEVPSEDHLGRIDAILRGQSEDGGI